MSKHEAIEVLEKIAKDDFNPYFDVKEYREVLKIIIEEVTV